MRDVSEKSTSCALVALAEAANRRNCGVETDSAPVVVMSRGPGTKGSGVAVPFSVPSVLNAAGSNAYVATVGVYNAVLNTYPRQSQRSLYTKRVLGRPHHCLSSAITTGPFQGSSTIKRWAITLAAHDNPVDRDVFVF